MSKKYGWVIHYDDGDMDYDDNNEEPYDTYEEAEEAALYADSCRRSGADTMNLSNPGDYPETGDDIDSGEIEVFEVD